MHRGVVLVVVEQGAQVDEMTPRLEYLVDALRGEEGGDKGDGGQRQRVKSLRQGRVKQLR